MSRISSYLGYGIVFLGLFLLLTACFEGEEGCLDIAAVNYDVTADTPCPDCCNFPNLDLSFRHKFYQPADTLNLLYENNFTDGAGNRFAIAGLAYYLSDVHLVRPDGQEEEVEDRIRVTLFDANEDTSSVEIEDNFALIDPGNFGSTRIGTIKFSGSVRGLTLRVGVPDLIQQTRPELYPADHPLAPASPAMYQSARGRYAICRLAYFPDTLRQTSTQQVINITEADPSFEVYLPLETTIPAGVNVEVTLEIDYGAWFRSVNVQEDDPQTISRAIVGSIAESIRVYSLTFRS